MFVGFLATDICFIGFIDAHERVHSPLHCLADTMSQMPSVFLRDAEVSMKFHTGYTLKVRSEQIKGDEPFLKSEFGVV